MGMKEGEKEGRKDNVLPSSEAEHESNSDFVMHNHAHAFAIFGVLDAETNRFLMTSQIEHHTRPDTVLWPRFGRRKGESLKISGP